MIMIQPVKQCQHFNIFKCTKHIVIPEKPECKPCQTHRENIWLCLHRQCEEFHCGKNQMEHLGKHFQQSKIKKKFHCLFIHGITAQIYCISCRLYIQDEKQQQENAEEGLVGDTLKVNNSAYRLRLKILPGLKQLGKNKINGQLQNSQAHQKIGKGSVGIFSNRFNHTIHSAVQFVSQCSYFRDIILGIKIDKSQVLLLELQRCVSMIFQAKLRAIKMEVLDQLVYMDKPSLLTYQRKDPFDMVLYILNKLHLYLSYYALADPIMNYDKDQWELHHKKSQLKMICPIYNPMEIKLRMNYHCKQCKRSDFLNTCVNFLKLPLTKKNRENKQIEKELTQHRYTTPFKHKKRGLMNLFFKEEPIAMSIHELIIEMLKKPLHKEKKCQICSEEMKKSKIQIQKLPDYLILQIARFSKEGYAIDETPVAFQTECLDFGAFTINKQTQALYDFQAAICIQKSFLYPVMVKNIYNKQVQAFRNQNISYGQKLNPYILCYKKRSSPASIQMANYLSECKKRQAEQNNNLDFSELRKSKRQKMKYFLPQLWTIQAKHGFQRQLTFQFICKHNCIKPAIEYKEKDRQNFNKQQFIRIYEQYKGKDYHNEICAKCTEDAVLLGNRKKKEKESILYYNSMDIKIFCMISIEWLNKWYKFLYLKTSPNYSFKGHPFPGLIDNKSIVDGNKCKPFLIKNKDFKVVNIYVWRFLKELYGGGIQIRYGWHKSQKSIINNEFLEEVRQNGRRLKESMQIVANESPLKKSSTMEQSSIFHQELSQVHE